MAASYNKVILMGNLTRDPDLRYLPNGSAVCELGIAVNRRYTNSAGQDVDEPCFVDVVVWGKSAENSKQYLEKGSQVMIEGRLQLDQWEDRNGGGKRSKLRVVAEQVQFLNRRQGNGGDGAYSDPSQAYGGQSNAGRYAQPPQGQQQPPRGFQPRQNQYGSAPVPPPAPGNQGQYSAPAPRPMSVPPAPPVNSGAPVPPMPGNAFNPDEGMDDDIPF